MNTPPTKGSGATTDERRLLENYAEMEAALTAIAEGGLGDAPWLADYDRIREYARETLERLK